MLGWMLRATALIFLVATSIGAAPAFDPKPWLEDLEQVRTAMIAGYANLEWAVTDRGADLPALYEEARGRIVAAKNDDEARAAFERFGRRIGDGHIAFRWKSSGGGEQSDACANYSAALQGAALASHAFGYQALPDSEADEFPAGVLTFGAHKIGVIRIGLFMPQAWPRLCRAALTALAIPADKPCDDGCDTRISQWAHNRMTRDLATQLRALKAAGADTLLVDITSNGGGSEWAEAAALMMTAKPLISERVDFVRTPAWVKYFADQERELRRYATRERGEPRRIMLELAGQLHLGTQMAAQPCDGEKIWRGQKSDCDWSVGGFYATGLFSQADPAKLRGKPFATMLYTPMQYPFEPGVWTGPLIVLVDRNSFSAAEEFAAVLQDNRAAVILGEPTGGAGCGHFLEGVETTLRNSGGVLEMPDCVRRRIDGSNEIRGIQPDVLVGFTPRDGAKLKAQRLLENLDAAIALTRDRLGRKIP